MDRKGIDSTFFDEPSYLFYVIVLRNLVTTRVGNCPPNLLIQKSPRLEYLTIKKNHTPSQIIYSKELNIGTLVLMQ